MVLIVVHGCLMFIGLLAVVALIDLSITVVLEAIRSQRVTRETTEQIYKALNKDAD